MASFIYNSFVDDLVRGAIDLDTDTFYAMLINSAGVSAANKDTHTKRSDVTGEVTGTGYSSGGAATTVTVTKDTANDREDIGFSDVSWSITGSLTARGHVIYKRRGGAATADELVAIVDYGADVTCTNGTFTARTNSPGIRINNP